MITRDRTTEVIINMGDVTFLDSAGISALLAGRYLAVDHGTTFRIENPRHRALTATGLLEFLIHPIDDH